ncbi:protein ZNRD2-like isoform X1 [Mytilus californianus]|uniref:protein ZNRD2-like isoform X1 n=1 Tax=Mytilus californianus TaxID=6549 RepID=UPI002245040C|nr:protein ZNRD2-like isoform X1 [Mytilus californianus]
MFNTSIDIPMNIMNKSSGMTLDDYEWQPPTEAERKIIQARRERSDKISSIMGEYLLKGYKMLGSTCQFCETILLETPIGEKYCIACKELDEDTQENIPEEFQENNPVFQAEASEQSLRGEERLERSDAISKLLGDYLLKGYKMLGSTCSKCDTILLQGKGRNEKDLCVSCEILNDGKDNTPTAVTTSSSSEMLANTAAIPNSARFENADTMSSPAMLRNATAMSSRPIQTVTRTTSRSQCTNTLSYTEDVLRHKIEWATQQLQSSSSVDYSIQICNLIKSAADAFSSLQTIKFTNE